MSDETAETELLDPRTEGIIAELGVAEWRMGPDMDGDRDELEAYRNALRTRIRALCSEARREGYRMRMNDVRLVPND